MTHYARTMENDQVLNRRVWRRERRPVAVPNCHPNAIGSL